MDVSIIRSLRDQFSVSEGRKAHLLRCWLQQGCERCLASDECSWCPMTWSCVPNTHRVQFLAPVWEENMCPAPDEQWELRTQPLGCHVSTITTITAISSIVFTMFLFLLVFLTVLAAQRVRTHARARQEWRPVWVREWRRAHVLADSPERDPLLQGAQRSTDRVAAAG